MRGKSGELRPVLLLTIGFADRNVRAPYGFSPDVTFSCIARKRCLASRRRADYCHSSP